MYGHSRMAAVGPRAAVDDKAELQWLKLGA